MACFDGKVEKVRRLLAKGVDANGTNDDDPEECTPLTHAAQNGHLPIVKLLLEHGAKADKTGHNTTPLHLATAAGYKGIMQELLKAGADVNKRDEDDGDAPLHVVSGPSLARLLIDYGADIEARNDYGATPLHAACKDNQRLVAKALLAAGGDVNAAAESDGFTALHVVAANGFTELAKMLIEEGADIDTRATYVHGGCTPLYVACNEHHKAIARLLVARGADIDAEDDNGVTPRDLWPATWGPIDA
jgi:ankyrin repeat protein